jgi:hypothetical protein
MDVPKDLGRRIIEMARLAVALHLHNWGPNPGGAGFSFGGAVTDDGASAALRPATIPCAGALAESEAA